MPTPFEIFQQRFGGMSLGSYNPFQTANQYGPVYTPGVFSLPTSPTTPTTPPVTPGSPGAGNPPGSPPVIGGQPNDPGGNRDNGNRPGPTDPGYAPGYSNEAALVGAGLGLLIPGAGTLVSAGNGLAGIQAANQQADVMGKVIGKDINLSTGDYINAATGGLLGDSAYEHGLGGYGQIGQGGITGMQNMADPGVMGAARAQAASVVNQMNPAGPIRPAPTGGLLSTAPANASAVGGLLGGASVSQAKQAAAASAGGRGNSGTPADRSAVGSGHVSQRDVDVAREAANASQKMSKGATRRAQDSTASKGGGKNGGGRSSRGDYHGRDRGGTGPGGTGSGGGHAR